MQNNGYKTNTIKIILKNEIMPLKNPKEASKIFSFVAFNVFNETNLLNANSIKKLATINFVLQKQLETKSTKKVNITKPYNCLFLVNAFLNEIKLTNKKEANNTKKQGCFDPFH